MEQFEISRTIHYVWLGRNEKPESVKKCIDSWKKYLPDYKIIEWNEDNFDIENSCKYVKEAYEQKKWAFVSDYIRLCVLWKYGGIYFDTDLEVLKSFDSLLNSVGFLCSENSFSVCTAVIGSEKGAKWIKEIIDAYEQRSFVVNGKADMLPNTRYIFDILAERYDFTYKESVQQLASGLTVYPKDYFSPLNSATGKLQITNNSYTIHHYKNLWISPLGKLKRRIRIIITRIIGEKNKERLRKLIRKS